MTLRFAPNLSMLYASSPFLDRFARAAADGYDTVEFLFPYEPGVEQVQARVEDLGLAVVLFSLHAGDAGEWGTLSNPGRRDFFRWSVNNALEAASRLNCSQLNVLFGHRVPGLEPQVQVQCAVDNLLWAAPLAEQSGVTLLVEPLNPIDYPDCLLPSTAAALEVINRVSHSAVKMLYDIYHAQMSEGNILNTIAACFPFIGHIQVADVPGRCEPGTGEINFPAILSALGRLGYKGYIGLEYQASETAEPSFKWLPKAGRR